LEDFGIFERKSCRHVLYQTKYMTDKQLRTIKKDGIPILFLFGDNDSDKLRDKTIDNRMGMSGQASVAGKREFEDVLCRGIITLWHLKCRIETKIALWADEFGYLLEKNSKRIYHCGSFSFRTRFKNASP